MKETKQSIINGIFASAGLLALYAITMTILNSWAATLEQFRALWYLMVPIAAGFGIQVGLYTRLKRGSTGVAAGGVSGGAAMVACCAHHATDVLPFVGLSGTSLFLTQFQKPILLVSLAVNAVGIAVMLNHLKKS